MARNPAKLLERLDVKGGLVSEAERAVAAPAAEAARARGRPARHEEPVQQTTIRLTRAEWAALQAQVTKETLARGTRRYVTDIVRDAVAEYLARHG